MSDLLKGLSAASARQVSPPASQTPSLGFSRPRNQQRMDLTALLNEPLPPMRSTAVQESVDSKSSNPPQLASLTSFHPQAGPPRTSLKPIDTPPLSSDSLETSDESHSDYSRTFTDSVMCSSSRSTIEAAFEAFRRESHSVPDFQHSTNLSVYAVQESFKSLDSWPGTQLDLWAVWSQITWLTELARVPTFPINPDKIALLLSVYVDLPCSKIVRELIRHRQTLLEPDQVLLLLHGMEVAGKASRDFWPRGLSFLRSANHYPSTALIRSLVSHKAAQKPAISGFAPPKPPPPPRPVVTNFYGPKNPVPVPVPARSRLSLRDLCTQLPSILQDLKSLPDEPQVFDIAQVRFQNASSAPAYVTRMPDLVQAAVLYTNITALLCFPTYPIDAVKLSIFGLAFTLGPLGRYLVQAAPELAQQEETGNHIRLNGRDMDKLMRDITSVRDITRGGQVGISEGETSDWREWMKELQADWKSIEPIVPKGGRERVRSSQNGGPPRKRAKLSPSPTNSENLRESVKTVSDRPSISKKEAFKPPPSDRSTPAPSITESISSPEVSSKPLSTVPSKSAAASSSVAPKGGRKPKTTTTNTIKKNSNLGSNNSKSRKDTPTNSSSRASTPASSSSSSVLSLAIPPSTSSSTTTSLVPFPRWKPLIKGKIPQIIPMPPVPPIRPSTRWLKQNRIKLQRLKTEQDGSGGGGSVDGTTGEDEGEEDDEGEEEEEEEAPRTIAASRPKRRGGLQMVPVDVEALWELARKIGYTQEALDQANNINSA